MSFIKVIGLVVLGIFILFSGLTSLANVITLFSVNTSDAFQFGYFFGQIAFYSFVLGLSSWGFYRILKSLKKPKKSQSEVTA